MWTNLNKILTRSLIAMTLASIGIFGSIVPEFSKPSSRITFSSSAYAQDFTQEEKQKFAEAILSMETRRQQAFSDITDTMGGTKPPKISCNDPESFRSLPSAARDLAVDFCKDSKDIVESSGLSVSRFNAIASSLQSDENLEKEIQNILLQIQRQ